MLTTTAAGRTWNFSHAIGRNAAAGAGFTQPTAVAVAPDGILYVLSRGQEGVGAVVADNKRIGKVSMDQEFISDFGRREFVWPAGLAVSDDGDLYCSDEFGHYVASYNPDGERLGQWGEHGTEEGQLNGPSGIAFDADDNLYVVDHRNHRVQRFTKDGEYISGFGEEGASEGQLHLPWGITLGGDGDLCVADWRNDRIQKFTSDGEFVSSFGESGEGDGQFNRPNGIAVDSDGDIYVCDWMNDRVQVFDQSGSYKDVLIGHSGMSKWGRTFLDANPDIESKLELAAQNIELKQRFYRPVSVHVDEDGKVYVADCYRHRVQIYQKLSASPDLGISA